jgi:hypothetical protein
MATDAELTAPIELSARIAKEKPVLRAKYGSRWFRGPDTRFSEIVVDGSGAPLGLTIRRFKSGKRSHLKLLFDAMA